MLEVRELWLQALNPLQAVPGFTLALVYQPLTKGMLSKSAQLGGNALGLTPDDGPLVIILLYSVHTNPADDNKVVNTILGLIRNIEAAAMRRGKAARYRFTNYAYKNQKALEGYGTQSVASLRAVSRKYDPNSFFQKSVPGGFKLSRVSDKLSDDATASSLSDDE